jgi:dipeptidyl aminopeptidase/acylaminoacyl peptidase
VEDSIEMARFGRSGGDPLFSPDQKHFVVVTSRGIMKTNQAESTLWSFESEQVRKFVTTSTTSNAPRPRVLARFRAVPQADYSDSYEPIISDVSWLRDSKALLFLAQRSTGDRRLYRLDLAPWKMQSLSPAELDVNQYVAVAGTVVYTATSSREPIKLGNSINRDAVDVTGLGWSDFLFVDALAARFERCNELWVVRDGRSVRVNGPNKNCLPNNRYDQVLSLSPDERSLIVVAPVQKVPEEWQLYRPSFPDRKIDPHSSDETKPANPLRLTQYELVSLNDGTRHSLVASPNGWSLGFPDINQAVWSHDGKKVLLLNTYLPLNIPDPEQKAMRTNPCSAAYIELASHTDECIVFSSYPAKVSYLVGASFAGNENKVSLEFWDTEHGKTQRRFQRVNGSWQMSESIPASLIRPTLTPGAENERVADLSAEIRQDLNTPPALWATDRRTGQGRKIWDPNPQLSTFQLGEASVFRWADSSGHKWTGGLVKPPDYVLGRRYPLVIQTHGFVENEFMTDGQYTTAFAARPLAAAGIVVLQMGENYDYTSQADDAPLQILGFESVVQQLASDGLIDAGKVGIIGFSHTCYHVEVALIKDPKLFTAATIVDGVDESYMQAMLTGVGATGQEGDAIYGGRPFGEGLQQWIANAPGFHLDRIQTPLRIETLRPESVLGEWEIYASLTMQHKPVQLIYFPEGQHILQKPLERLASQQGNVDWFRFWLKNEDAANSGDSRNARLRKMRDELTHVSPP